MNVLFKKVNELSGFIATSRGYAEETGLGLTNSITIEAEAAPTLLRPSELPRGEHSVPHETQERTALSINIKVRFVAQFDV